MLRLCLSLALTALPAAAQAYIGPGLGAGTIGVVLGVIGSIFLALFALLWYPFKRLMKKRREAREAKADPGETTPAAETVTDTEPDR